MNRDSHIHQWRLDGEAVRTGGDGRVERYREIRVCMVAGCRAVSRGPWQVRRLVAAERPQRTEAELTAARNALYGE